MQIKSINTNLKNFVVPAYKSNIAFNGVKETWNSTKQTEHHGVSRIFDLFSSESNSSISKEEAQFIEEFCNKEEEIKQHYDNEIEKIKDGFLDNFFSISEKKRNKLRKERDTALRIAYQYQDAFERREDETIKLKNDCLKLAQELNFSKEVIAAFEAEQTASLKRKEINKRRQALIGISGFGQIGGYEIEKNILRQNFIDKLDDEKSGKVLNTPLPNAILFYGPTGCGKTTFAEAFAQEADCNYEFLSCRGTTKEKEKNFINELYGTPDKEGLLNKALKNFKETNKRTIILVDEFDRFFAKDVSEKFIRGLKGLLENCSRDYKVTFFLTTNNPQKIPYELRNSHRTGIIVNLDPPDRKNSILVIEHYLKNCETDDLNYQKILDKLFKYAPDSVYSNSHLKTICEIATDKIKPVDKALTTEMFLQAIDKYEDDEPNKDLCRITKKYLLQYEDDKKNI